MLRIVFPQLFQVTYGIFSLADCRQVDYRVHIAIKHPVESFGFPCNFIMGRRQCNSHIMLVKNIGKPFEQRDTDIVQGCSMNKTDAIGRFFKKRLGVKIGSITEFFGYVMNTFVGLLSHLRRFRGIVHRAGHGGD